MTEQMDKIAQSVKELDAILGSHTAGQIVCEHNAHDALIAACENAIKQMQDKPVQAQGEWEQGLMCGLEDMSIDDRHMACRHGYDKALDKVQEWIIDEIEAALDLAKGE